MNTIKIDKYFRGMVANRGLSGIETENTIFSFLAASNRSYFGISCDLNVSKDSTIIITLDDTLLRLGLLNLYIPSFTYDELRKFSLVDRKTSNLDSNIYIPKLVDFLAICKVYRKVAFINLSNIEKTEQLDRIVEEVDNSHDIKRTMFLTNNKKHVSHLLKKVDSKNLFYRISKTSDELFDYCKNNGINAHVTQSNATKEFVKNMHLYGLKVSTGIVNDKDNAEKLIKYDIDYIFTDILE